MAFVEPVTLEKDRITLTPLTLAHEDGLRRHNPRHRDVQPYAR